MVQRCNQVRAMLAITKGSLKAIFRSPSSVAFSFGFPLVFILVFGFINGGGPTVSVALANSADSANYVIKGLLRNPLIRLAQEQDSASIRKDLERGRIGAVLSLDSSKSAMGLTQYTIHTLTSSASGDKYPLVKMALAQTIQSIEEKEIPQQFKLLSVDELPELP